jgi:hypothetical protein
MVVIDGKELLTWQALADRTHATLCDEQLVVPLKGDVVAMP